MITPAAQHLRVLPSEFTVEQLPAGQLLPDGSWYVLHRAPEGLTVREMPPAPTAEPGAPGAPQHWTGLYGETSHGLDLPGMLAAVLGPLVAAGVPVFVSSSYLSDLVLVPRERRAEACSVLREAGHTVTG
ncbi:ACT domain-containing protein [Streptomyces sp. NPDC055089]